MLTIEKVNIASRAIIGLPLEDVMTGLRPTKVIRAWQDDPRRAVRA